MSISSPIIKSIYPVEGSNVNDWISKEIYQNPVISDNTGTPPIINENNSNWAELSYLI